MSDIKLFRISDGKARVLPGEASDLEKPLQTLIENNLEELLGVRFLATEYSTGKTHGGRIDTLGIDEDSCPTILEYKRSLGENVINQGLYYLNWLLDHKAEFELLVLKRLGAEAASQIDWDGPRIICIAADFTKYDGHAVQQMSHGIELIRYRKFGSDLLLLELVNATSAPPPKTVTAARKLFTEKEHSSQGKSQSGDKTVSQWFATMSADHRTLFDTLEGFVLSLGDDVQRKDLKLYVAYKRLRNFVTVCFKRESLLVYLKIDPETISLETGFSRDVRQIGHWGTGDVELTIQNYGELDRAKSFISRAYES